MTIHEKQDDFFAKLFGIVAFVAGIIGLLVSGWRGLVVIIIVSLTILGCYYIYQYFSVYKWKRKAHLFSQGLINREYLEWQQNVLKVLYPNLEFVSLLGNRYPAAILRSEKVVDYPFRELCRLQGLKLPEIKPNRKQKQYIKLLGDTLHAPRMKGFALSRVRYNSNGKTQIFEAITTNQYQNLLTHAQVYNTCHPERSEGSPR